MNFYIINVVNVKSNVSFTSYNNKYETFISINTNRFWIFFLHWFDICFDLLKEILFLFSRFQNQLFVMSNQLIYYFFDFVFSFKYKIFCNVFVINVINVCIELKFSLSQKKNIFFNSIFELFERLKWIYCFYFNNHLKQLTFINYNFFKFIIAFMKKNLKLSKHLKKNTNSVLK